MRGKKQILPAIALLALITALPPSIQAGGRGMQAKNEHKLHSLFLINDQLPHLMQPITAHWDDPALGLSKEQKEQLMGVRKQSMTVVQQLQRELPRLVQQVKKGMKAGQPPEELSPIINRIADLKTRGTMVHLNCLYRVRKILDDRQLRMMQNLAGKK